MINFVEADIWGSAHKDVYYMDYIPKKVIKEVIEPDVKYIKKQ